MASNHRSRGQEGPAGPISRPAEGDDQESAASTFAPLEVEQVLLQHPDIVQAFVVGIPEIVARGSRAAGPGRQRIRWLAETCPIAAAPRLATAGAVSAVRKASRAGTL
jgi:hypothetical protein